MQAVTTVRLTVAEFEALLAQSADMKRVELVDGELMEKPMPTQEHGQIQGYIFMLLFQFAIPRKLGRVSVETLHTSEGDAHNVRLPDVSFMAGSAPLVTEGSVPRMPDLAVEVKSPSETLHALLGKAYYYLAHGSKVVWLIEPSKRLVLVITQTSEEILLENDVLQGGELLEGFSVTVRDIFTDPLA
jgi:Uma2 family endonuclease